MKRKFTVTVTRRHEMEVVLDDSMFTPEFFDEFNSTIVDFGTDITKHVCNLASLTANSPYQYFVEGYGALSDLGVEVGENMTETSFEDFKEIPEKDE